MALLASCTSVSPSWDFPDGRPVVLTTEADLASLRDTVDAGVHADAWAAMLASADSALDRTFEPQQLADHEAYFDYALADAQAIRDLVLVLTVTEDARYGIAAETALTAWAQDAVDGPTPGRNALVGQGLVIGRVMTVFADAYAILEPRLGEAARASIREWFRLASEQIMASRDFWETTTELCDAAGCGTVTPPWINDQVSNHLSAQNMGLLALGYALHDHELVQYAISSMSNHMDLQDLIDGAVLMSDADAWFGDPTIRSGAASVQPGELWDRLRIGDHRGLHYAHIQLRFLTLQALMAANNDYPVDWFAHVGPDGENLRLSFDFYSEFLLTDDSSVRGGYYAGEEVDLTMAPLYEIAARYYPGSPSISAVVAAFNGAEFDRETFGWSLSLTHGRPR